jgi:subtilisin family serine protease
LPGSEVAVALGRRLGATLAQRWGRPVDRLRTLGAREFDGQATWSGTSFATPLVVGTIAALMSGHGLGAPEAQRLLAEQCLKVVDLGAFGTK